MVYIPETNLVQAQNSSDNKSSTSVQNKYIGPVIPGRYIITKCYQKSCYSLLSRSHLVWRVRSRFRQTILNPRNGRTDEFHSAILIALGVFPICLCPCLYTSHSLNRCARDDEMRESQPVQFLRKKLPPRAVITLRLHLRVLYDFYYRFQVVRAMPDESMVCGGGDEVKVAGELRDCSELDRREDVAEGSVRKAVESESDGDSVNSKGVSGVDPCEHATQSRFHPSDVVFVRDG